MKVRDHHSVIQRCEIHVKTIPTDGPEADGTFEWNSTTIIIVELHAGGRSGLGYTYAHEAAAAVCRKLADEIVIGRDAMKTQEIWNAMVRSLRNAGRRGIAACAVSAIDNAVWDLKARLLDLPLASLLGACRKEIPVYGSGGFTSYSDEQLRNQMETWVEAGIKKVKMKVGADASDDLRRVQWVRKVVGPDTALFVDANGGYSRKQALQFARLFGDLGVTWFEEPVSSDDLEGLRLLRDEGPPALDIAAGEYGYEHFYFRRMLEAGAVDCLQADVTRCEGVTGFLKAAALCEAFSVPLSSHCAPALHVALGCAVTPMIHLEFFHDHVRIEEMLFEGMPELREGRLRPNWEAPGNGLRLKRHLTS